MKKYEYGRIEMLESSLMKVGVDQVIIEQVMAAGEKITKTTTPQKKADWMRGAMQRMDDLMDFETRCAVREDCACCLGGKREKLSKAIVKEYATLEERVRAANETKFVFGHSVTLQDDGRILVEFSPEGQSAYRCVCLPQASEPLSVTYCYCCGGHVKHHLQNAIGKELRVTVRSSALSSGGKRPCTFLFDVLD